MLDLELSPRHDLVMLGDVNIDYNCRNPQRKHLNDFLKPYNLSQHLNSNTRVTSRTATCIDHVYVNKNNLFNISDSMNLGLSDHSLFISVESGIKLIQRRWQYGQDRIGILILSSLTVI